MNVATRSFVLLVAGVSAAWGSAAYAPAAQAGTQVTIGVRVGVPPPPVRVVHAPPPRRGYIWAPGYWRWQPRAHRHVWVDGYWVRVRPGYRYRPARWVHEGRDWRFHSGHWER